MLTHQTQRKAREKPKWKGSTRARQGRFLVLFENLFAGENFKGDASVKEVPLTHRATRRWPPALSTSPKWLRWGDRLGQPRALW